MLSRLYGYLSAMEDTDMYEMYSVKKSCIEEDQLLEGTGGFLFQESKPVGKGVCQCRCFVQLSIYRM